MAMSAEALAEVQEMIKKGIDAYDVLMQSKVSQYVQEKLDEEREQVGKLLSGAQTSLVNLETQSSALISKALDSESRVSRMLEAINQMDDVQARIREFTEGLEKKTSLAIQNIVDSFNHTLNTHKDELVAIKSQVIGVAAENTNDLETVKEAVQNWGNEFQAKIEAKIAGGNGAPFAAGAGAKSKFDKKEVNVWKLPEEVGKPEFRHWIEAVNLQLEAVHGFDHPEHVLNRVRLSTQPITQEVFDAILDKVNDEDPMKNNMKLDEVNWEFDEKTRFMYTYLVGKLNHALHEKTTGIESRNGLELYRLINESVDAVPENTKLFLNSKFMGLLKEYADKIKNIKDLWNLRQLMKRQAVEYKRAIGHSPDPAMLMDVIWNVMDVSSKMSAQQDPKLVGETESGVAKMNFENLVSHIDRRYKMAYDTMDFSQKTKDDPMGLSAVKEDEDDKEKEEESERADLDYVNKGTQKGKGKGKNSSGKGTGTWGKCNTCGGDGHYAIFCPSGEGAAQTSHSCFGCNGKGHFERECPTKNPDLKGDKGKGKGKDSPKGGGNWGKGQWQKGKGGGKKGLSSFDHLDLMGASASSSWGGQWPSQDSGYGNDGWGGQWGSYGSSIRSLGCLDAR